MWWPPYHWAFQVAKPTWSHSQVRYVCAAMSAVSGAAIRYATPRTAAASVGTSGWDRSRRTTTAERTVSGVRRSQR